MHRTKMTCVLAVYSCWLSSIAFIIIPFQPVRAGSSSDSAPLEWQVLLIIKAEGQVQAEGLPEVRYKMTPRDIEAVNAAFTEYTPEFVKTLSKGRLEWKPEVMVSSTPLRKVSKINDGCWIGPECAAEDIEKHVTPGKYDGIFIYWKDTDDITNMSLKGGFGWTIGPDDAAKGCGYTCVNYVPPEKLTRESEWTEVFIHEWLHQLEAFYGSKGVKIPRGGLHGDPNYGFKHENGWKHWYKAFINAELEEEDGSRVGLGEEAWKFGTIRGDAVLRQPEYLTPERSSANLLAGGSFEGEAVGKWSLRSWRGSCDAFAIVIDASHSGTTSAILRSATADDALIWQKVDVKPGVQYLLSGWVKTENVIIDQEGGTMGANLCVEDGLKTSRSLEGTNSWTYLTVIFNSGDKATIEVEARLGNHGSVAMGTAWFDDLVLIEIPNRI